MSIKSTANVIMIFIACIRVNFDVCAGLEYELASFICNMIKRNAMSKFSIIIKNMWPTSHIHNKNKEIEDTI